MNFQYEYEYELADKRIGISMVLYGMYAKKFQLTLSVETLFRIKTEILFELLLIKQSYLFFTTRQLKLTNS